MKKINFLYLCISLMLFTYSCAPDSDDPNSESTVKIEVDNMANEEVRIYYYDVFDIEMTKTIMHCKETRFIYVVTKLKYYARGESTNKEYGERNLRKAPSNVDVRQTWVIK